MPLAVADLLAHHDALQIGREHALAAARGAGGERDGAQIARQQGGKALVRLATGKEIFPGKSGDPGRNFRGHAIDVDDETQRRQSAHRHQSRGEKSLGDEDFRFGILDGKREERRLEHGVHGGADQAGAVRSVSGEKVLRTVGHERTDRVAWVQPQGHYACSKCRCLAVDLAIGKLLAFEIKQNVIRGPMGTVGQHAAERAAAKIL